MLDGRSGTPQERHGSECGTARGDEIVDHQDPVTRLEHVGMDLDRIDAVLKGVILPDRLARKLSLLAHRDETDAEFDRDARAENEASRLDPRDMGNADVAMGRREPRHAFAEPLGALDEGRDVAEQDTLLGVVGDRTNEALEVEHGHRLRLLRREKNRVLRRGQEPARYRSPISFRGTMRRAAAPAR